MSQGRLIVPSSDTGGHPFLKICFFRYRNTSVGRALNRDRKIVSILVILSYRLFHLPCSPGFLPFSDPYFYPESSGQHGPCNCRRPVECRGRLCLFSSLLFFTKIPLEKSSTFIGKLFLLSGYRLQLHLTV